MLTPKSMQDRISAAQFLEDKFKISTKVLIDPMSNELMEAFAAWPERLYILRNSKIEYVGGPGPFWYSFPDLEKALRQL